MQQTPQHVKSGQVEWHTEYSNYPASLMDVYRLKRLIGNKAPVAVKGVSLVVSALDPGATYPSHSHPAPEIYYFLKGRAECTWGDETFIAEPGTVVYTPPNLPHSMRNIGDDPVEAVIFWWGDQVGVLAELTEPEIRCI
ncbi:MAG: cupin domain-containing protein [Chloroflexi bacterium]|nr:cupin domain-containing protein [Chloroflexota bacterium]